MEQLVELLLEQAVVVAEVEAEERERLDERAAPDHHLRASAGEQIERRELLIEPNRDCRAEYGDRAREPDALRTRRGRREHDGRSGDGELGPVVLADAVDVEPDLVRELDLLHELAQALLRAALAGARVGEGEGADLHDLVLPVACASAAAAYGAGDREGAAGGEEQPDADHAEPDPQHRVELRADAHVCGNASRLVGPHDDDAPRPVFWLPVEGLLPLPFDRRRSRILPPWAGSEGRCPDDASTPGLRCCRDR